MRVGADAGGDDGGGVGSFVSHEEEGEGEQGTGSARTNQ